MATKQHHCKDCGTALTARKTETGRQAEFCSTECRKAFNNRRAMRGSVFYDIIMSGRYNRKGNPDYISTMTMIARYFREADEKVREGRPTWSEPNGGERDVLTEVIQRMDDEIKAHRAAHPTPALT